MHLGALGFVPLAMGHPEVEIQDTEIMSSTPDQCCIAIRRVMLAARRDRYLNVLRMRFEISLCVQLVMLEIVCRVFYFWLVTH